MTLFKVVLNSNSNYGILEELEYDFCQLFKIILNKSLQVKISYLLLWYYLELV